jgi:hypothetical protein
MTLIIYKKRKILTFLINNCSQHDVVCCRACLWDSHRSCVSVLPLNFASKDVQDSTLLSDTLIEQDYMSFFSCTDPTSVIHFFSMSSRYFRTFDLAALICFIINDFLAIFNFTKTNNNHPENRQEDS